MFEKAKQLVEHRWVVVLHSNGLNSTSKKALVVLALRAAIEYEIMHPVFV